MNIANEFVGHCLMEGFRKGRLPTALEAEGINTAVGMAILRPLVTEEDLSWLLPSIAKYTDQRAGLLIGLLAAHATRPRVQEALRNAFDGASPYVKSQLLWRLTDDPSLPLEWREKLFEYVLSDWDTFQKASVKYLGSEHALVLARALERYSGTDFPESKQWAYLCSASGATEYRAAVRTILHAGLTSNDEFTRDVARRLLDRS